MHNEALDQSDPLAEPHRRYMEALKEGDVAAVVATFADDAVFMPPNDTSVYGRAELTEWHDEYFEHFRIVTFVDTERDVTFMDAWAVERWTYSIAIVHVNGGESILDDGRWFAMWKRDAGGVWKIVQGMFNSIRPIGSGTSRFISRMSERKESEREEKE